jgi:hypothetical protein
VNEPQALALALGLDHGHGASRQASRVVFFTDAHRIVADVDTGQRRLVEVLRDGTRAYLDVAQISLTRIDDPTQPLAASPRGVLRKSDVRMAAIVSEENRRPERRLYAYVAKASVRVVALLPSCSIVGDLHLPDGTTDGVLAYLKMSDSFVHLTDALIQFTRTPLPPNTANTVVVNRASVELLCMAA